MITEAEIIDRYKYVLVDDVYLFASLTHEGQELGHKPANIIYVTSGCPYCGGCCDRKILSGPGGWSYDQYRCGTIAAWCTALGMRPGHHQRYILLAISKQTSKCQLMLSEVGQSASSDDII